MASDKKRREKKLLLSNKKNCWRYTVSQATSIVGNAQMMFQLSTLLQTENSKFRVFCNVFCPVSLNSVLPLGTFSVSSCTLLSASKIHFWLLQLCWIADHNAHHCYTAHSAILSRDEFLVICLSKSLSTLKTLHITLFLIIFVYIKFLWSTLKTWHWGPMGYPHFHLSFVAG